MLRTDWRRRVEKILQQEARTNTSKVRSHGKANKEGGLELHVTLCHLVQIVIPKQ